jgi:phage protein U
MSVMPMLILGAFPFSVNTAAYQQLQRSNQYQWASQARLGKSIAKHLGVGGPAYQFIGPGDETISLNGAIYPQYVGLPGRLSLSALRLQADAGIALPLVSVGGLLLGRFIIEQIQETDSALFSDGSPRKIEFTLSLKRYNEDLLLL